MKSDTSGIGGFAVLTVVLTCLAVQAVFTLPACGDEIVAWGANHYGQATPPEGHDFTAVDAGSNFGLALKSDGSILGWGYNVDGQATPPLENHDFIAIAAGKYHSLALRSDGSIVGWGQNLAGQATPPSGNDDFIAVAAGGYHSLALRSDGSIVVWGSNYYGQATLPEENNKFIAVAAGGQHSLALKSDGSIVAWGNNNNLQATPPLENHDFIAIAAGSNHSLALRSDGSIVGWGLNDDGQATPPLENHDFIAIAAGAYHSLALKSDGSIVAWGRDVYGEATTPEGNGFTAVHADWYYSLVLVSTNSPPVADADGPYLVGVGQTIVLDGSGSYDEDGDFLSYLWTQVDPLLGSFDNASAESPNYTGSQAGITDLTLTVSDSQADNSDTTMLVVYDPSGGFVTGGGWIWSPLGAYTDDPTLEGKANFGFVSKYKKGAEVPTGQTEFVFQAGDLDFHSNSYDWLVVTGSDYARFKGWGSINGEDGYRFMLWAGDDPDTFRIRIWTEDDMGVETDVYDNGSDQGIGGGSIVIHAK